MQDLTDLITSIRLASQQRVVDFRETDSIYSFDSALKLLFGQKYANILPVIIF